MKQSTTTVKLYKKSHLLHLSAGPGLYRKYRIYHYSHIFVTCGATLKTGIKHPAATSKLFNNLKLINMPKKNAQPRKNKPTKKKSSAQKKADPKKKAR